MKKFFSRISVRLVGCGLLAGLMVWGGLSLLNQETSKDDLLNFADLPTEFVEKYFDGYSEMAKKGEQENILTVVSTDMPNIYGAIDVVEAPNHTYLLMYDSEEARENAYLELVEDKLVSVEKNVTLKAMDFNSWGIERMGLDVALEAVGQGGETVKVAIIDTGLDVATYKMNYPHRNVSGYNIESSSSSLGDMIDKDGHGTHVTGTVTEGTPDNVEMLVIRASRGSAKEFYSTDVLEAVYYAIEAGADVINMSLGTYSQIDSLELALRGAAQNNNTVSVAAAGNDGTNDVSYPAGYDCVLSVAAVGRSLNHASYSNYGSTVDFVAPGTSVGSINGVLSGTSMATPHVSAAVAILKSYNVNLPFVATKTLLSQHARDLGDTGWDEYYGYGMIDFTDAEFCDGGYCDEYGVFAVGAGDFTEIEVSNVKLTDLNYYSIQNLMLTEVNLFTSPTSYITKKIQEISGIEISGYDAEAMGEQDVTITFGGLHTTMKVTNPAEYESGWEYEVNEDDEILLTGYTDNKDYDDDNDVITKIYAPTSIGGKNVVAFAQTWKSYTYGDNNEYTGQMKVSPFDSSVYASGYVEEVYLPEPLVEIGEESFANFTRLKKIVMQAEAVRIKEGAFYQASSLKMVEGNIVELGPWAFEGAERLKSVGLAYGLTVISQDAFNGCAALERVQIPNTVTDIETGAFSNSGLVSINIPTSVTNIEQGAFGNCGSLESIVVDEYNPKYYDIDSEVLMEDVVFDSVVLVGTKSFNIPAWTTHIGEQAFSGIKTVTSLVLPNYLVSIGEEAFYGCTGLSEVTIPKDAVVEELAFGGTSESLKLKVYSGSSANNYAVRGRISYETLDASYARVVDSFNVGDTLSDDTEVEFYYDYGVLENGLFSSFTDLDGQKVVKKVNDFVSVEYPGEVNHFRAGDTYFVANYKDNLNKNATIRVNIVVDGEPAPSLDIDNLTHEIASVEEIESGVLVTSAKPCIVLISRDAGETYEKISATKNGEADNEYRFEFEKDGVANVKVILKGDGNLDGVVSIADSNMINKSLVSNTLIMYRQLTDFQKLILDLNNDSFITLADSNTINKSLVSDALVMYRPIQW